MSASPIELEAPTVVAVVRSAMVPAATTPRITALNNMKFNVMSIKYKTNTKVSRLKTKKNIARLISKSGAASRGRKRVETL